MVASPLETRSLRGSGTSHSGMATSMCAPASTVAMVSGGVPPRTVATTCCGASRPGEATDAAASRAAASVLAARPAAGGQSWPGPLASTSASPSASTCAARASGIRTAVAPVK